MGPGLTHYGLMDNTVGKRDTNPHYMPGNPEGDSHESGPLLEDRESCVANQPASPRGSTEISGYNEGTLQHSAIAASSDLPLSSPVASEILLGGGEGNEPMGSMAGSNTGVGRAKGAQDEYRQYKGKGEFTAESESQKLLGKDAGRSDAPEAQTLSSGGSGNGDAALEAVEGRA